MAQTLLGKVQILISATLHSLLDRALDSNSLAVFDEYIRDAEQSTRAQRGSFLMSSIVGSWGSFTDSTLVDSPYYTHSLEAIRDFPQSS